MRDGNSPVYQHDFVGGSIGSGVRVHATRALALGAEVRWHTNLTQGPLMGPNESRRLSVLTVTGGATLRW